MDQGQLLLSLGLEAGQQNPEDTCKSASAGFCLQAACKPQSLKESLDVLLSRAYIQHCGVVTDGRERERDPSQEAFLSYLSSFLTTGE